MYLIACGKVGTASGTVMAYLWQHLNNVNSAVFFLGWDSNMSGWAHVIKFFVTMSKFESHLHLWSFLFMNACKCIIGCTCLIFSRWCNKIGNKLTCIALPVEAKTGTACVTVTVFLWQHSTNVNSAVFILGLDSDMSGWVHVIKFSVQWVSLSLIYICEVSCLCMPAKASVDVFVLAFPGDATKLETSARVSNCLRKPR